jgi:branched-chain amino acid transport system permease protein
LKVRINAVFLAIAIALLCSLPIYTSLFFISIIILTLIVALLAVSWDLLFGFCGQLSLAPILPYGIAAFATVAFQQYYGFSSLEALSLGVVTAVGGGLVIAAPALRIKGAYLSIITLAALLIAQNVTLILSGEGGITTGAKLLFGGDLVSVYYGALGVSVGSSLIMFLICRSRIGLRFKAIREDETLASYVGVNTTLYKILAFATSALFAGIAGGFLALYTAHTDYTIFVLNLDFEVMTITLIGGAGTIIGPFIAAFMIYVPTSLLISQGVLSYALYGALIVIVVSLAPQGLLPTLVRYFRKSLKLSLPKM